MREREIVWGAKHKESGKENTEKSQTDTDSHKRKREANTMNKKFA